MREGRQHGWDSWQCLAHRKNWCMNKKHKQPNHTVLLHLFYCWHLKYSGVPRIHSCIYATKASDGKCSTYSWEQVRSGIFLHETNSSLGTVSSLRMRGKHHCSSSWLSRGCHLKVGKCTLIKCRNESKWPRNPYLCRLKSFPFHLNIQNSVKKYWANWCKQLQQSWELHIKPVTFCRQWLSTGHLNAMVNFNE